MFSKQAVSYLAFLMVVLVATSSAVQTIAELQLIEGSEAQNSNNTAKLLLHRDVLQGDAYRDIPCHVVSVCGKQGVMKSTLLRALSIFFDMAYGAFHTNNLGVATTTTVDISDVSRDNHILIDIIGNDDPSFAMPYGLDPLAVDRAFSQLVAPAANVLIYPIKQKICGSDLESLAMYADHAKYQVGQLQKNLGVKPTLIIVIRTSALYCTVNLKPQMCEPEEYLRQSINLDHPMWSSFSRIELVQIPELHGADWEKIQPSNFRPREVPQFWDAIKKIGTIVNDNKQAELSLYWTGGQLGRMFEMMLPMINDDIGVDPPSVRRSLITSNAQSDAQQMAAPLDALMQACVEEPFRGCDSYGEQLSKARKEAEVNVLLKYDMHKAETKMYAAIQQTVAEVFNKKEKEIKTKVESRKQAIQGHLQSVYESARTSLSNTEQSLSNVLSGDAVEVDSVLVNSLNDTLQQYHAALDKWTLPEQSAKSCYDKLKNMALLIWTSAHEINNAKHINRMHNLRSQALPPVEFDYINSHNTPSFEHTHVREDLGKKYSDYFSDQALRSIISIDADFNAGSAGAGSTKTGGYGRLVLEGQNKEYVICQHADSNFRGHGNYLSYNPVTKELHAWTYGWGFRGGKHTNRNWMSGVKFTVTSNALSAKPEHYALPYVKGTTPDMFLL